PPRSQRRDDARPELPRLGPEARVGVAADGPDTPCERPRGRARAKARRAARVPNHRAADESTQQVSWHRHPNVKGTFYVLEGRVRIPLREPDDQIDLAAGESWGPVRPGRPHQVTNPGEETATFLVLQGIGEFDFVTVPDQKGRSTRPCRNGMDAADP